MKIILMLGAAVLCLFVGEANAQRTYQNRSGTDYPFGYRSPYQGGFNGYGSYYGRSNQLNRVPLYPNYYGGPSRMYPSYQPYLNPNYRRFYNPYAPYYFPR